MAGWRRNNPAAGDDREQEEAEEITALSPKILMIHLLAVEESLGDLHDKFDRLLENFEVLNRRMDGMSASRRIEAEVVNGPDYDPPQLFEEDAQEGQEPWQELQDDDSTSSDEQGICGTSMMKYEWAETTGGMIYEERVLRISSTMDTLERKKVHLVALKLRAAAVVSSLNLKAELHPNPNKIGWVKKGGEAMVNEICIVPLSIGSGCKDKIICDVIEGLGDTQTLHKGRENTYEFYWMGKKVVLLPLTRKSDRTKGRLFTVVSGKRLLKEGNKTFWD
ncbi:plasma membrane ATPase 1 [Cucumis melo var. makuwa]|uniref:Plasma membrane ATPase 1 n=1 Tax=Cucumis melo var. makuwa TaxID=1194695 RepID=A0A5D3CKV3_CUCMM|nr:plasma membrane ATPase 1 [Cucumis melo var. makuwa]TYK12185.1 plasma membrane ATPase 1 [Cucumis melo var. makuwa]